MHRMPDQQSKSVLACLKCKDRLLVDVLIFAQRGLDLLKLLYLIFQGLVVGKPINTNIINTQLRVNLGFHLAH